MLAEGGDGRLLICLGSNKFMTSAIASASAMAILFLFQFNSKRVVQREHQVGKLALFQPCYQLFQFFLRQLAAYSLKIAFVVFADGV